MRSFQQVRSHRTSESKSPRRIPAARAESMPDESKAEMIAPADVPAFSVEWIPASASAIQIPQWMSRPGNPPPDRMKRRRILLRHLDHLRLNNLSVDHLRPLAQV